MADVFISYARPDETHSQRVAETLRAAGFNVWRDDELPAHRLYAEVIEERLKSATCVIVLWSVEAARSQWVRAEADIARAAGTLVQATLDGTIPPLPFNQIHCADLNAWSGDTGAHGWCKLLASAQALVGSSPVESPVPLRSGRPLSICVLPFQNMSGDAEQEYFSDGISEDITTDLAKISALGVIARNTAFTFKGRSVNVCEVARKLGVGHVLEGSVRKAGGRVRISAQLVDGASGDHVWAERYDRDLDDIFAIQDEISKAIVGALRLKLLPHEKKALEQRGTTNAEAYNLYLLARQYWITGNFGDVRREERVMRICSRAVQLDPYYGQAWALLAFAQSTLRYCFGCEVDDGFAAAHAALSVDSNIAEAHCTVARRLEERLLFAEANAKMETALRVDPDSWDVNKEIARVYLRDGRVAEAARYLERAVLLMESDAQSWARLVTCYHALGDAPRMRKAAEIAVAQAEQVLAHDPSNGAVMSFRARGYAALGEMERAKEWIERGLLIDPDNLNMRYNLACTIAVHFDEKDAAISLLERNFAGGGVLNVKAAEADPDLNPLRDDPRFQAMLDGARRRLGMVPVEVATTAGSNQATS
jgi:adenylate cyclase